MGIEERTPRLEGTVLEVGRAPPRELQEEAAHPLEEGIVPEEAHPLEEGIGPEEAQANLWAVGKILGSQVPLVQLERLDYPAAHQQEAGTAPQQGVGIVRTEQQGVDIDPEVGNSPDKHTPEAVGNIVLVVVDSIPVVLAARHILLGVDRGMDMVVGQVRRLGVGRALDPLEVVQPVREALRSEVHLPKPPVVRWDLKT